MMGPALRRLRLLVGLVLAGQGLLIVTRILDHEAPLPVGFGLLVAGLAILAFSSKDLLRGSAGGSPARARIVLGIGAFAVGGVLVYNLLRGSTLAPPEVAILVYGLALIVASRHLDRVGRLVAYSFPLVLAPLSLYALNAAIYSGFGAKPLAFYIRHGLVAPMATLLTWSGLDVVSLGDTVRLGTPAGALFLTVGVVCAGLYAGILFMGVFALFAWESSTRGWRLAAYLGLGLLGLHLANVVRLVLLAVVGQRWGGVALQNFHTHAGWVLFLAWGVLFWWLVLRRFERPRAPGADGA